MPVLLKAIYKQGVFEPCEAIENLTENQEVQLQLWPDLFSGNGAQIASSTEAAHPSAENEAQALAAEASPEDDWFLEAEEEWEKLSEWERQGIQPPTLTPEEIEERVKWVRNNWGSLALPSDLALEIATADWIAEENWDL